MNDNHTDDSLILAAEECPPDRFDDIHAFSEHDERVLRRLVAHGPVLLQGGRGSGKSALMIAAGRQMMPAKADAQVVGLYVSLRYVPLLQATGDNYQKLFCEWVSSKIGKLVAAHWSFPDADDVLELKNALTQLAIDSKRRVVLLFDDAAHIGRETSLGAFFDIFRMLSSDLVSCKAAIYPGVTEFGTRFDIYNDATVVDVVRSPEQPGFEKLFEQIMRARYPKLESQGLSELTFGSLAHFLGAAVLGNVRGFIFACNYLIENADGQSIGYNVIGKTLLRLAADYYWPLLEEVKPKLGRYVPAVEVAQELAEEVFQTCAGANAQSMVIHKKVLARFAKSVEILEYAGFVARREASRALKSGGRGPRYAVNLCNLLERTPGTRLTAKLFQDWLDNQHPPLEVHERGSHFSKLETPVPATSGDLGVFALPVGRLAKSRAYPYGLTEAKIATLKKAGIETIGSLSACTDDQLRALDGIGDATVERIHAVLGQAIWM